MALIPLKKSGLSVERRSDDFFFPLQREVNRLMDDFFSSFPSLEPGGTSVATPVVNVSENEKSYCITAELPGIQEKDIDLSVSNKAIQIKAEKEFSKDEEKNGFITMERSYGSFYRLVPLSADIDENKIKASLKDGVLTIDVPKTEEAIKRTKKISVQKG